MNYKTYMYFTRQICSIFSYQYEKSFFFLHPKCFSVMDILMWPWTTCMLLVIDTCSPYAAQFKNYMMQVCLEIVCVCDCLFVSFLHSSFYFSQDSDTDVETELGTNSRPQSVKIDLTRVRSAYSAKTHKESNLPPVLTEYGMDDEKHKVIFLSPTQKRWWDLHSNYLCLSVCISSLIQEQNSLFYG